MLNYIFNIVKGALMGAANVIPGVSGGTMALLTGIFERLIKDLGYEPHQRDNWYRLMN